MLPRACVATCMCWQSSVLTGDMPSHVRHKGHFIDLHRLLPAAATSASISTTRYTRGEAEKSWNSTSRLLMSHNFFPRFSFPDPVLVLEVWRVRSRLLPLQHWVMSQMSHITGDRARSLPPCIKWLCLCPVWSCTRYMIQVSNKPHKH